MRIQLKRVTRPFRYFSVITIIALLSGIAASSFAGWKRMARIPVGEVYCGFFFDDLNGFVGSGSRNFPISALIRRTSDGGVTWAICTTPPGKGLVTDIMMKDPLIGYASIFSNDTIPKFSIWKTTDGGTTWTDGSHGNNAQTSCVYATGTALIRTLWDGIGGYSTDDGVSFSGTFIRDDEVQSNGIDFSDDRTGVVVMGPRRTNTLPCWSTTDGGTNWSLGDTLPEAWSVYALKGTKTFFTLPESDQYFPGKTVYWSQNGGMNWAARSVLPVSGGFTGHIGGVGNTVYVQTDNHTGIGLYRSDDLGLSWKNVGGPSNQRDTRFVVTGCKGQVVYAFDDQGYIWKTADGGDGKLDISPKGIILAFPKDSIFIETRYCQPVRSYFFFRNSSCDSLIIDTVTFSPDPYHEFSVDTIKSGISLWTSAYDFGIPIVFRSDSNVTRHVVIRIHAHSGGITIDTSLILVAKHSTAPEPYLGGIKKTKTGDIALVPVFLRPTQDSFAIRHCAFHLSYDGDILSPATVQYQTAGTFSRSAVVTIGNPEPNGIQCTLDLNDPITQDSDLSLPLIYLRMGVTLSRSMSCPVRLDTFSISAAASLPLCSLPETEFIVDPQCGDSAISYYMKKGNILELLSVHPNPNSGGEVEADISVSQATILWCDIFDAMGKPAMRICSGTEFLRGRHILMFGTSQLAGGKYILRLRSAEGIVSEQEIVVIR